MKHKFGYVLGAVIIIGMIDLAAEQVVFATIYNPLNPSEEITPKDPPLTAPVDEQAPEAEEPSPVKEEQPKETQHEEQKLSKEIKRFLQADKQLAKRVTVADMFLSEGLSIDLALPDEDSGSGGDDKQSYLTNLCYLFTGSVLYGQTNDGGLKTHVFDIFE